jgi:DNA-binding PucR family transcriptional regulator
MEVAASTRPAAALGNGRDDAASLEHLRLVLAERLCERRSEIEGAIFDQVHVGFDPAGREDAEYIAGVRAAVVEAVEYSIVGLTHGERWLGSVPPAAAAQARRAARNGVSLETVLHRYTAGNTLMEDILMQEVERCELSAHVGAVREVLRTQGSLLGHLTTSAAREYHAELERAALSPELRRTERVQRLLVGGRVDAAELGYELRAWHLGLIAMGEKARQTVEAVATELGRELLSVARSEETVWVWLGGRRPVAIADVERLLHAREATGLAVAIGEPGEGTEGWRLTHRQAQAAMVVTLRRPRGITRFSDVGLAAAVLRDEELARSLVELHLSPLGARDDGGAAARETLRAYFAAGCNAATAAAALGVGRHTVARRLRLVEDRLGRSLRACQPELEVALRLEELGVSARH